MMALEGQGRQKLIVIGNGMAAMRTVEHILEYQQQAAYQFDITVVGAEPYGNYNRIMLSPVLSGEKSFSDIMINTVEWYAQNNIQLLSACKVTAIDKAAKTIVVDEQDTLAYDQLLLATGSNPFIIPVEGKELPGVFTYRTIDDVNAMTAAAQPGKQAVVIGAGVLGLEAAYGLLKQGMQVSVVHRDKYILNRQLDKQASLMLKSHLEGMGIKFYLEKNSAVCEGEADLEALRFSDGESIPADMLVMAVGIKANYALAEKSGLHCERGIVVNDYLLTDDPAIHAVGECVQHQGMTYGLVAPLFEQASVCAKHILGLPTEPYLGSQIYTSLKVTGVNLYSAGDFNEDDESEVISYHDANKSIYKKLVIKNERIVGVNLYGDIGDAIWYQDKFQQGENISSIRQDLIFGQAFMPEQNT